MHEQEVWIVVDEDGNGESGSTRETAWAAYQEQVGWDDDNPLALRWVQCTVKIPLPKPAILTGTAPADGNESTLTVR